MLAAPRRVLRGTRKEKNCVSNKSSQKRATEKRASPKTRLPISQEAPENAFIKVVGPYSGSREAQGKKQAMIVAAFVPNITWSSKLSFRAFFAKKAKVCFFNFGEWCRMYFYTRIFLFCGQIFIF